MTATAKAFKGLGMEGRVAQWYATNTGKDRKPFRELASRIAAGLPADSAVLEVAPGPGYFAIELAKRGPFRISALDISSTFVDMARKNARAEGVEIDFRQGDAAAMPYGDDQFDRIVCRAAFKNFSEPVKALREMRRVLKPGGKALIIDLRRDVSPKSIAAAVDKMGMSRLNRIVTRLTFRFMLIKRAYTEEQFRGFIAQSGFAEPAMETDDIGLEVWLTK